MSKFAPFADGDMPTLEWGTSVISWGLDGYRLWMGQTGRATEIWELRFVRSPLGHHRIDAPGEKTEEPSERPLEEVYLLQGDDRLLLISEPPPNPSSPPAEGSILNARFSDNPLTVRHILAPQEYVAENWPIRHASMMPDGSEIAVAGLHGLVVYSRRTEKWRLFGDVHQERSISVALLNWLEKIIVVCNSKGKHHSELLLFPHYHLDFGSLLLRRSLPYTPVALDCLDRHILIASEPLNIVLMECEIQGELTRSKRAKAVLHPLRELSILSLERPLVSICLTKSSEAPSNVHKMTTPLKLNGMF